MTELKLAFIRKMVLALVFGIVALGAQSQHKELAPVTRTYALKNANIIQAPGRKIEMGTLVIRNGIITAVGKNVAIPPEAMVIEADSMYIYAGFIDGLSHTGVPKPKDLANDDKVKDPGNPPNSVAGIEPQRDVRNLLSATDKSIDEMRRLGFTAAHTVPHGKMLPGQGAIILLAGASEDAMVYKEQASLYSQLEGAPGIYPNTVIGVMAKYRELYRQAEQAKTYNSRYAQNATGMERPKSDRVLEAFHPVIDKTIPVVFKAEDVLSIQRVLSLQKELGFNLVLANVKQGWDLTDKFKTSGAKVFLSLYLPEIEEEKSETDTTKTEAPEKKVDPEQEKLLKRKAEMINKYYQQPALMHSRGVQFGFSTLDAKSKEIKATLTKLIEKGLTEEAALGALTTAPAQLLGLSATMGTIDEGKMANLVITDKSYFDEKSEVKYVFVDGQMFDYKDKPKTKTSDEDEINVAGKWSYTTETPQGVNTGDIIITGTPGDYSGTISISLTGDTNNLSNILVDGDQLSFSFTVVIDGDTLTVEVTATIDGDTFEGTMTAGEGGTFPFEGERIPEK